MPSTNEDVAVAIDVLANDTDADNAIDATTVSIGTGPGKRISECERDDRRDHLYTKCQLQWWQTSFSYTVDDVSGGTSNAATVSVTVNPTNDNPVAVDDIASTNEDIAVGITVLTNDTDADNAIDATTVAMGTGPTNGSVSVNATTGEITYTPNANYNGGDSFTYTVDDVSGGTSNAATVSVTVNPVNDNPVAVDDIASTNEDIAVGINVLSNDTDADNAIDATTVAIGTGPTNGSVSVNATTGEITYTPNANYNGGDSFSYTVDDVSGGTSNAATVSVTVNPTNDNPVAVDDIASTNEDIAVGITVLTNDTDADNAIDATTVAIGTGPTNGSVSVNATTGEITYTPNANYNGGDSFSYTVDDVSGGTSNAATVSVTVNPVNDNPVAVDDIASTNEDIAVGINVLSNDTDADNAIDATTVAIGTGPTNGSVSVNATTGEITYTPNANYNGGDSFSYTVDDVSGGTSNAATVSVTVNPVNDNPVAVDDIASTNEDIAVGINVLSNDTDADNAIDATTVAIGTGPTNGSVSVNATTGEITYTPNANYNGGDSFTYTVDDVSGGTSNAATVSVTVNPVNDNPVALDDIASTNEDIAVDVTVLTNDSDADDGLDITSVAIVTGPTNGSTSVNATTGVVTYTPNANYSGADSFTYTVDDASGATSNTATVSITINNVNIDPVAGADVVNTNEDMSVDINVLSNDTDSDGTIDITSVLISTTPSNGSVTVSSSGIVTYIPNQDFSGSDSFTYTVRDDNGATSNTAIVNITISPINDLPVALDDSSDTEENSAITIVVLENDYDIDDGIDQASLSIIISPQHGVLSIDNSSGTIIYTPDSGYLGEDNFSYTVDDISGANSNIATVTIMVSPINQAPLAVDDGPIYHNTMDELIIDVFTNDSDPDNSLDELTIVSVSTPHYGEVILEDGLLIYVPDIEQSYNVDFTYTIQDPEGLTSTATVTIEFVRIPLEISEGFSPNNDGNNDNWYIAGIDYYPNNNVQIFNRWGILVFKEDNYNNESTVWDGRGNAGLESGKVLNKGTYYYVLNLGDDSKSIKGHVMLVH